MQKVCVESFLSKHKTKSTKIQCQFFLDFFLIRRFLGCFLARRIRKHYPKNQNNHVEKLLQNKSTKKYYLFIAFFGRFSARGVQKLHSKCQKNICDPVTFLASDLPTYLPTYLPRGSPSPTNFLGGPLGIVLFFVLCIYSWIPHKAGSTWRRTTSSILLVRQFWD
jgi:hypothetical protein